MLRRFDRADWAASVGAGLGLIAAFVPWYSYVSGSDRITVNAFRASLLGDVFYVAIAATALVVLSRHAAVARVLSSRYPERQVLTVLAACALASVVLQLMLAAAGGRSVSGGLLLALVAALALAGAAWFRGAPSEQRHTVREMLGRDDFLD